MLYRVLTLVLITTVQLGIVRSSAAMSLPVVNPGFESTSNAVSVFNEFTFGAPDGWQHYEEFPGLIGNGASNPFFTGTLEPPMDLANPGDFLWFPAGPPEGDRVAILFNRAFSGATGEYGIEQTLTGQSVEPLRRYTLEVEVGDIASGTAMSGEFFNLDGFPGYRVELLAGGQVIGVDNSSLSSTLLDGQFATSTITVDVGQSHIGLGQDLGIRLVNLNQVDPMHPTADLEVDFDDVRLRVEPLVDGDFNFDGTVDAIDYTVWRNGLGVDFTLTDRDTWVNNYGATFVESNVVTQIPEPLGASLLTLALLLTACQPTRDR